MDEISTLGAIGGIPADVPVLILAGGADRRARPEEAQAIHGRIKDRASLVIFEKAGHLRLLATDPARYRKAILDFVQQVVSKYA